MATLSDLTQLALFAGIPEASLEKAAAIAVVQEFAKGDVIYTYDEHPTYFCVVLKGRVMFERTMGDNVVATIMTLNSGDAFGLSALLEGERHKGTAVCREAVDILLIPGMDLAKLMEQDTLMGFTLMKRLYAVTVTRMNARTEQFLKLLGLNPELREVMG